MPRNTTASVKYVVEEEKEGERKKETDGPTDRRKHRSDTQPGLLRVKCSFYPRRWCGVSLNMF